MEAQLSRTKFSIEEAAELTPDLIFDHAELTVSVIPDHADEAMEQMPDHAEEHTSLIFDHKFSQNSRKPSQLSHSNSVSYTHLRAHET